MNVNEMSKEIEDVYIKHRGACPKHKGHFDLDTFAVGFLSGGIFIVIVLSIIAKFYR